MTAARDSGRDGNLNHSPSEAGAIPAPGPDAATVPECDAPYPSLYIGADGETRCRCVVCSRCGHHTGNAHQGHFWSYCSKTRKDEGFHFCCPDLPCEYPENE